MGRKSFLGRSEVPLRLLFYASLVEIFQQKSIKIAIIFDFSRAMPSYTCFSSFSLRQRHFHVPLFRVLWPVSFVRCFIAKENRAKANRCAPVNDSPGTFILTRKIATFSCVCEGRGFPNQSLSLPPFFRPAFRGRSHGFPRGFLEL